ncbi:MAG: hypothetical protein DI598_00295, partial [Pseudopedobacter saltans]
MPNSYNGFIFICCVKNKKENNYVFQLQPFNDLEKSDIQYVVDTLKKKMSKIVLANGIVLPNYAYVEERKRYKADSIIHF